MAISFGRKFTFELKLKREFFKITIIDLRAKGIVQAKALLKKIVNIVKNT